MDQKVHMSNFKWDLLASRTPNDHIWFADIIQPVEVKQGSQSHAQSFAQLGKGFLTVAIRDTFLDAMFYYDFWSETSDIPPHSVIDSLRKVAVAEGV